MSSQRVAYAISGDHAKQNGFRIWMNRPARLILDRFSIGGAMALLAVLLVALLMAMSLRSGGGQSPASAATGVAVVIAVVLFYLGLSFAMGLTRGLKALDSSIEAVANGDLTRSILVSGDDEIAALGTRVEQLVRNYSQVVATVRSNAQLIAMSGDQLATSSRELSDHTVHQAASLEETSANVQELAAAVRRNAEDARVVDSLAGQARGHADDGVQVVGEAVSMMQRIEQQSRQMSSIVSAIDGIAFQTNILALNAAVEAARAGESGRGFAVVAAEVRSLAQRSAKAAAEVKNLIAQSGAEVADGVRNITRVSDALATTVGSIREVSERVRMISSSSEEQSRGLAQMAEVVKDIDSITQRNAAMVDQSAEASDRLRHQARDMASKVLSLKLRQGCADEARALAERAAELVAREGVVAAAARFHDKQGGFIDRDLFIILLDRSNYFRAFGMDPGKANKPAVAAPGVNIGELNAKTWAMAEQGGGWVEFCSLHPISKQPVDKMAYVAPIGNDLLVMCSVNKSEGGMVAPR